MHLLDRLLGRGEQASTGTNQVQKLKNISWWRASAGAALCLIGLVLMIVYLQNYHNLMAGAFAVFTLGPGVLILFITLKPQESGYAFDGKRAYTGQENAIILFAQRNPVTQTDAPVCIRFAEIKKPPRGARLHYVRNLKKHFYELYNNTETKRLEPVMLPDKKAFPPELFRIPACMQTYKDAIDYSPPSMLQKVAPGVLLLAMGIVGLLMVVTGG